MEERRQLKNEYGKIFDSISALLFQADPIGIAFNNENPDEYDPETGTILPRLETCNSTDDVRCVIHEEFVRWFDSDTAGSSERYESIAPDVWRLWTSLK